MRLYGVTKTTRMVITQEEREILKKALAILNEICVGMESKEVTHMIFNGENSDSATLAELDRVYDIIDCIINN